jgi:hypothetical protein
VNRSRGYEELCQCCPVEAMESNYKDKRSSERLAFLSECRIEYEGAGSGSITARINDLSDGGAFIDTMNAASVGSKLNLRFRVQATEISALSEVRFVMPMIGMGVKFLYLSPEHLSLIQQFLYGAAIPSNQRRGKEAADQTGPEHSGSEEAAISGKLSIISILDVIHIIERGTLTGALSVTSERINGRIYFNDGLIVNASDQDSTGIPALKGLLASESGTFEFHLSERPFEEAITTSNNTALVLDLLVAQDQASVVEASPTHIVDSISPTGPW